MIDISLCRNCGACAEVCPVSALEMKLEKNGFKYPYLEKDKCIDCGLCHKVCDRMCSSSLKPVKQTYAARSNSAEICGKCRSGGVFFVLADKVIRQFNGVVYGVSINGTDVEFSRVVECEQLESLVGSKYVWVDHTKKFKEIENDLNKGTVVLISGLPCQVDSIKNYLDIKNVNQEKLILCDIICHGAPSPKLYKDYICYQENKYGESVKFIDFRNKKNFGWKAHIETLYMKRVIHSDLWTKIFYSHLGLKNSCFECPYKSKKRAGDISLGDCWNIEKSNLMFNDDKGTSLLLVNSDKGLYWIERILEKLDFDKIELKDYMQPALEKSVDSPTNYNKFWEDYEEYGFEYVLRRYVKYNWKKKLKCKLKIIYYKFNKMRNMP